VPTVTPRQPQTVAFALPLLVVGMAGIYFLARGIGDFVHGRSHTAGTVFVLLGLACYFGGIAVGRWLRRRRAQETSDEKS
jgi:drug/metabolite transporter (DMT)-like permease